MRKAISKPKRDVAQRVAKLNREAKAIEHELGIEAPANGLPPDEPLYPSLEEEIHHVLVWTSLADALMDDVRVAPEMTTEDRVTISQLYHVLDKAHEAARTPHDKYHGRRGNDRPDAPRGPDRARRRPGAGPPSRRDRGVAGRRRRAVRPPA